MIDFPASPTVGQTFTAAGVTWIWDGAKWLPSGLASTVIPGTNDNRIINGDMRIDQRNNGASGTVTGVFTVDRWYYNGSQQSKGTWQRASSQVVGFPYCLGFTSSSAYTAVAADTFLLAQSIEADVISDFAWGTANAQSVTLSFWTASSLAGTLSGTICNYLGTRSYPFTFVLVANTWTKVVVTIPGDTTGIWVLSGNGGGAWVQFDLGSGSTHRGPANAWGSGYFAGANGAVSVVGTNGASFYVTGVKLEIGSVATPYNRQSLAKSMADCQRYYAITTVHALMVAASAGNYICANGALPISTRAVPTLTTTTQVADTNLSGFTMDTAYLNSFRAYGTATANGTVAFDRFVYASAEL